MDEKELIEIDEYLHKLVFALRLENMHYYSNSFKNVSLLDLKILRFICEHEKCQLKDIRAYAKVPNSTLTSVIKRLEKRKLIERFTSPEDNRSFIINVTDYGARIHEEHRKIDMEVARKFLENIPYEEDRKEMIRLLKIATAKPIQYKK